MRRLLLFALFVIISTVLTFNAHLAAADHIDLIEDGAFSLVTPGFFEVAGDPMNILTGQREASLRPGGGQAQTIPSATNSSQVEAIQVISDGSSTIFGLRYLPASSEVFDIGADASGFEIEISEISGVWNISFFAEVEDANLTTDSDGMDISAPGTHTLFLDNPNFDPGNVSVVDFTFQTVTANETLTIESITVLPEPTAGLIPAILLLGGLARPRRSSRESQAMDG